MTLAPFLKQTLNEAEVTLPPFLAVLEQGQARRIYTTPDFADIRQTPVPLWELADLRRYASSGRFFAVLNCSQWPLPWRFTATIFAKFANGIPFET